MLPMSTHPKGTLLVGLSSCGNVDFDEDPDSPMSHDTVVAVESMEEASRVAQEYRDRYHLGGGNWVPAPIVDADSGEQVAYVSYNGRVWPGSKYDPKAEPLCEAAR